MLENVNNIENRPRTLFNGNRRTNHLNRRYDDCYESMPHSDGGTRPWLVMVCAFMCFGLLFGMINSYGVIYAFLQKRLSASGSPEASSNAALIGSLNFGTTLFFSPLAGFLSHTIGMAHTSLIGGITCVVGLLLSSFFTHDLSELAFTYGFVVGFGASLIYTPTLSILGLYFKQHLGKVNGFVSSGASIFMVIAPQALLYLLWRHDLAITLRVLAAMFCFLIVAAFVYEPIKCFVLSPPVEELATIIPSPRSHFTFKAEIWKNRAYIFWTVSCALAMSGFYVPYVHLAKLVDVKFPQMDTTLPIMCVGATSSVGRIVGGIIADVPGISSIRLHQIALLGIGTVTILLPLIWSYDILICLTLLMGLFDGLFFPLLYPIVYELVGNEDANQAIGFFLALVAVPLTVGPVLVAKMFDDNQSYTLPFILAGIPIIVGALLMRQIKTPNDEEIIEEIQPKSAESGGYNRRNLHENLQKLDAALQKQKPIVRTSSSSSLLYENVTSEIDIKINNDRVYSQTETTKRKYKYSIF